MIQSGRLRHVIEVFEQTDGLDSFGKPTPPRKLFNVKGNVQILSGTEIVKSGATLSNEYVSILVRYNKRITSKHTLKWEDGEYDIDMIRPDDKRTQMIITCSREF